MKLTEKFIRTKTKIQGNAVGFRIDEVRLPIGKKATREYLDHPGAVAVVAVTGGKVLMVQQYRHPVGVVTLEIPAGKLARGENPLDCVKRELQEETGYTAGKIRRLLSFWPTAAFANELIHIYVAEGLKPGKANPDDDEFLSCKAWPLKKIYAEIEKGRIRDSKTIIAMLAYRQFGTGR